MLSHSNRILTIGSRSLFSTSTLFSSRSGNSILPFKSQICCQYRSIFITYLPSCSVSVYTSTCSARYTRVNFTSPVGTLLPRMRFMLRSPHVQTMCDIRHFASFTRQYFPFALQLVFASPLLAQLTNFLLFGILRGTWLCSFLWQERKCLGLWCTSMWSLRGTWVVFAPWATQGLRQSQRLASSFVRKRKDLVFHRLKRERKLSRRTVIATCYIILTTAASRNIDNSR